MCFISMIRNKRLFTLFVKDINSLAVLVTLFHYLSLLWLLDRLPLNFGPTLLCLTLIALLVALLLLFRIYWSFAQNLFGL